MKLVRRSLIIRGMLLYEPYSLLKRLVIFAAIGLKSKQFLQHPIVSIGAAAFHLTIGKEEKLSRQ